MIANPRRLSLVTACFAAAVYVTAPSAQPAAGAGRGTAPAAPTATSLTPGDAADDAGLCSLASNFIAGTSNQATGLGEQQRKGCPPGVRSCPASQVGQPCDPSKPAFICSAQANGAYCCLAQAGAADVSVALPAGDAVASADGGGPCCTHQDKTGCAASCQAAGCARSIAACINLRCSCRCSGCP